MSTDHDPAPGLAPAWEAPASAAGAAPPQHLPEAGKLIITHRLGDWMQTFSGRQFWPLDPHPDDICIEDIAAGLSKLCRYGGQCLRFYSVAEHCVLLAATVTQPSLRLAALMHDAAEAYAVDIPRPLKRSLVDYRSIEARIMRVIAAKFQFDWPVAAIAEIDDRILADERDQNMSKPPRPWFNPDRRPLGVKLEFWEPERAMSFFLTSFYRYGGRS